MLTPKQEKYVQGLIKGLSQRQSYIEAYPNARKWKESTVDSKASTLLKNGKVLERYNGLINEHKEKALWTREDSVNTLKWLINQSIKSVKVQDDGYIKMGTSNAILGAIRELNQLEVLYPLEKQRYEIEDIKIKEMISQEEKPNIFIVDEWSDTDG